MIFTGRNPDICKSMSNIVSNLQHEAKKRQDRDGRQDLKLESLVRKTLMDLVALTNSSFVSPIPVKLLTDFSEDGFLPLCDWVSSCHRWFFVCLLFLVLE